MTTPHRFKVLGLALALVSAALLSPTTAAQKYPDRPVRLIVPFAPGGGTDILGRVIAPKLAEGLVQPVPVENRAGAGSNIGADVVAKAPADGYTLLLGSNTQAINASLYPKLPFDTIRDFAPVSLLAVAPMAFVAHPGVPVKTIGELIALAKRDPGKLNFASPGTGTPHHIAAELFMRMASVSVTQVPYKGAGPALTDVLAGQAQFTVQTLAAVRQHIGAGKVTALGMASGKRAQVAPDIPTVAESGLPGYEAELWFGILAPAATPAAVIDRLNAEIVRAMAAPEIRERLQAQGFELRTSTPAELAQLLKSDIDKYARVIRDGNIKVE